MKTKVQVFPARAGNESLILPPMEGAWRLLSIQAQFFAFNLGTGSFRVPMLRVRHGNVCQLYDLPGRALEDADNAEHSFVIDAENADIDVTGVGDVFFVVRRIPSLYLRPQDRAELVLLLGDAQDTFGITTVTWEDYSDGSGRS